MKFSAWMKEVRRLLKQQGVRAVGPEQSFHKEWLKGSSPRYVLEALVTRMIDNRNKKPDEIKSKFSE